MAGKRRIRTPLTSLDPAAFRSCPLIPQAVLHKATVDGDVEVYSVCKLVHCTRYALLHLIYIGHLSLQVHSKHQVYSNALLLFHDAS